MSCRQLYRRWLVLLPQAGWRLMTAGGEVLRCYKSQWEARYHSGGCIYCTACWALLIRC
jgi:hypothetical protein